MKSIHFAIVLIIVSILLSCDARERTFKTNAEVLKENKLLDSFSERINYFPKSYTETIKDTLLANGYHVKIKYWSDETTFVTQHFKKDSITHKNYYKEFKADIEIKKNNEIILAETIDKAFIKHVSKTQNTLLNNYILKRIWIDEYQSELKKQILIYLEYCSIENTSCLTYQLITDENKNLIIREH